MKANEVMIGDWVSCGGHYRKIQSLEFDNTEEEKCWFWSDEDQALCLLSEHDQIPLTPEILEKNGFINGEFYAESHIEDWQIMSDCGYLAARSERGWSIDIPCRYIHELQHALRLCGISKEIVL